MKFAFSTISCPNLGLDVVAARAGEWGYDGVEVVTPAEGPGLTTTTLYVTDPDVILRPFERAGVKVACLTTAVTMTGRTGDDEKLAAELQRSIDTAQRLGCTRVRLCDRPVRRGQDKSAIGRALGDWLLPLADYAAEREVTLLVTNSLGFRRSADLWVVLDRIHHPSVACCWDLLSAMEAGERPETSVPVLNSRIAHAVATDIATAAGKSVRCKLGDGELPVQKFITKLRGIGFSGYVTFEWPGTGQPAENHAWQSGDAHDVLRDAIATLKTWRGDMAAKIAVHPRPAPNPAQKQASAARA